MMVERIEKKEKFMVCEECGGKAVEVILEETPDKVVYGWVCGYGRRYFVK